MENVPPLYRIVVAVDPPASSGKGADASGLVAAGIAEDGTLYVIADETQGGLTPAGWSRRAIALWRRLQADALVVEVNQGGEMVKAVIGEADAEVPVISVRAKKGKWLRAEPVAALFEQGGVKLAGTFPALEPARSRRWKMRCATSASTVCRWAARPTGSMRWSGRCRRSASARGASRG